MTEQYQSNNNDLNYTDQTIQWARESLQRRRKELQEKKKSLVASYKQSSSSNNDDDDSTSQPTRQQQQQPHDKEEANDVTVMLERGRALLAEAEAHSEILGRYASPSNTTNENEDDGLSTPRSSTRDDFMTRFLQDSNNHNDNDHQFDTTNNNSTTHNDNDESRIIPTLPVEMPAWDKEFSSGGELVDDNDNTNNNGELQELLREGEARARLDELIANARRQGDDKRYATELLDAHNNSNTPTKKISTFDPSSMYAARRAELKKMKLDEEVAAAEEEARALSFFKALPLPGGVQVKNNPFASTQSFEMKQVGSVEKLVRRNSKLHDQQQHKKSQQHHDESSSVCSTFGSGTEESMSMATTRTGSHYNNNNTIDTSFTNYSDSYANEEDRERAKQLRAEKKLKKKQLLDAVNQTIMAEDMNESLAEGDEDDDARSTITSHTEGYYDIVEDPSKLRQDIARLEAKLKQKKTQRLAILNDIVDIDLDAPFDRLLSDSSGSGDDSGIRNIIDRLKKQVCGSVNDFQDISSLRNDDEMSSYEQQHTTRASLYERQEEWARQREQKLFEARLQSEASAMQGITGRPQLSHAARSWKKAKESHDTTLKRCAEIEERKEQEKEAREKATNELKMKELEELQRQASLVKLNKSSSSVKSDMNKEEQMKRLEMLSKPRQTRETHHGATELEDNTVVEQKKTSEIFGGSPSTKPKQKPIKPFFLKPLDNRVVKTVHDVMYSSSPSVTSANDVKERPDELFHGKHSFSDMSDKEFAKLVRRIEKQAAMSSSAKMMKKELDK